MVEDYKGITDSEDVGKLCKGLGDQRGFRFRLLKLLLEQPDHEIFVADLVRLCSVDPQYYLSRDTANFHLQKMADANLIEIEDVTLEKETQEGRLKIQAVVRLKKDVRVFVKDL